MNGPEGFLIGGEWRESDEIAPVHFPCTGEVIGQVYLAKDTDIEDAVLSAVRGFEVTRKMPVYERTEILIKLCDLMQEHSHELIEALILEGGKTWGVAKAELDRACETIRISAEEAKRIGGEIISLDWTPAGRDHTGYIRRFPLGPVLAIVPFNYPLNLACHKLGPAVAAGNSIIIKPSSKTPLSGLLLGQMVIDAGFPGEAISVVTCPGARAEQLCADPRIAYLSFTGSAAVGWHLKSIAGQKRIGLELGGNAAVIVHEDADIPYAVGRIASGGCTNAGQNCISVQRVLLHRPVYDQALELLLERFSALKVGDPRNEDVDVGPMVSREAAAEAHAKVLEAVAQGATILCGGGRRDAFVFPTVLADTTPDMAVNRTELFAPVITVTPYDTFKDAVARANDTEYGLQAGIFTRDIHYITQAFEEIRAGGLQVNDIPTFRMDHMPYGGVKASGVGREGPRYTIAEMTEERLMVINNRGSDS